MTIEAFAILLVVVVVGIRLFFWFTAPTPPTSDPWGPDIEQTLRDPDLPMICHRCLTPHPSTGWFCPTCGASVGPYNNYMPFIYIFSQGEVLRAGVTDHIRRSPLTVMGYLLYSLGLYSIFAPFYWYFLFRNLNRHRPETDDESEQQA
jgi:hypothetical protein